MNDIWINPSRKKTPETIEIGLLRATEVEILKTKDK